MTRKIKRMAQLLVCVLYDFTLVVLARRFKSFRNKKHGRFCPCFFLYKNYQKYTKS